MRLERDGASLEAFEVPVETGLRFEGADVVYVSEGSNAQITWIENELQCEALPAE